MKRDRQIDKLADQFESAWNSGQRISADEFLAQFVSEETIRQDLLEELHAIEQELRLKYPQPDARLSGGAIQRI